MPTPRATGIDRYNDFLTVDERTALEQERVLRRGHAIVSAAALLDTLGLSEDATRDAVSRIRDRLGGLSVEDIQLFGAHAVSLLNLLEVDAPDPIDVTPTSVDIAVASTIEEPGVTTTPPTKEAVVEPPQRSRVIPGTQIIEHVPRRGMKDPVVPASAIDLFTGVLNAGELKMFADLRPDQIEFLLGELRLVGKYDVNDVYNVAEREAILRVMELSMQGHDRKLIAEAMAISEDTVIGYMSRARAIFAENNQHARRVAQAVRDAAARPMQTVTMPTPAAVNLDDVPEQVRDDTPVEASPSELVETVYSEQPTVVEVTLASRRVVGTRENRELPVPGFAHIERVFADVLTPEELVEVIGFNKDQVGHFLRAIEEIYRQESTKPGFAPVHTRRLRHIIGGKTVAETAEILHESSGAIGVSAYSVAKIFGRAKATVRQAFLDARALESEAATEFEIATPVSQETTIGEQLPSENTNGEAVVDADSGVEANAEVEKIWDVQSLSETFVTLFPGRDDYVRVLGDLLQTQRTTIDPALALEVASLINTAMREKGIVLEELFVERGQLSVVRSFIGHFSHAGKVGSFAQRPPRPLSQVIEYVSEQKATAYVYQGLGTIFTALQKEQETIPAERQESLVEYIENACWMVSGPIGLTNEQTTALIDRLVHDSSETDEDAVAANITILKSLNRIKEGMTDGDHRLLRGFFSPRVGKPPLSAAEMADQFSDMFGNDTELIRRRVAELLRQLGSQG